MCHALPHSSCLCGPGLLQALARQVKLERPEEIRKELEYCERVAAERVQRRYKRHFAMCRDVAAQIIDLVTMVGEYRLLNEKYVTQLSLRMPKGITTVNQCKRFFLKT